MPSRIRGSRASPSLPSIAMLSLLNCVDGLPLIRLPPPSPRLRGEGICRVLLPHLIGGVRQVPSPRQNGERVRVRGTGSFRTPRSGKPQHAPVGRLVGAAARNIIERSETHTTDTQPLIR